MYSRESCYRMLSTFLHLFRDSMMLGKTVMVVSIDACDLLEVPVFVAFSESLAAMSQVVMPTQSHSSPAVSH